VRATPVVVLAGGRRTQPMQQFAHLCQASCYKSAGSPHHHQLLEKERSYISRHGVQEQQPAAVYCFSLLAARRGAGHGRTPQLRNLTIDGYDQSVASEKKTEKRRRKKRFCPLSCHDGRWTIRHEQRYFPHACIPSLIMPVKCQHPIADRTTTTAAEITFPSVHPWIGGAELASS